MEESRGLVAAVLSATGIFSVLHGLRLRGVAALASAASLISTKERPLSWVTTVATSVQHNIRTAAESERRENVPINNMCRQQKHQRNRVSLKMTSLSRSAHCAATPSSRFVQTCQVTRNLFQFCWHWIWKECDNWRLEIQGLVLDRCDNLPKGRLCLLKNEMCLLVTTSKREKEKEH